MGTKAMPEAGTGLRPDPRWTGVLLVGGQSSRMGKDKLRLPLPDGGVLADLPAHALAKSCGKCCSVRRADGPAFVPQGFEDLVDVAPGGGPLAGVVAAILAASTPWLLIVGGDMPALTPTFLRAFMTYAEQEPGRALMIGARRLQPMPLALPVALGSEVIERYQNGERALRRAMPASRLRLIEPAALMSAGDSEPWWSVNTPEEWRRFSAEGLPVPGSA
ncbi:MAG: molybdenum cofactor guanylyltransferase [Planctomycetota bacterium]|nr:molybdenum cofactor guanylyltransferase [Planctomycetota bacterium]